jgi:gas vesicle protein
MSDLDLTKKTNVSRNQKNAGSPQNLKDQMADAGADTKQPAGETLRAAGDTARDTFQEATEAAKSMASDTADKLQDQVREQQHTGADFVNKCAGSIREAARAFENDLPFAARGINSVAEYVEDAAEKIRDGSFRDLVDNATDFAKRRPAAFLGVAVLAGFAAVRFLKASGQSSSSRAEGWKHTSSSSDGDSWKGTSTTMHTGYSENSGSHLQRGFGGSNRGQSSSAEGATGNGTSFSKPGNPS